MSDSSLVINAGSSSLKFQLFDRRGPRRRAVGDAAVPRPVRRARRQQGRRAGPCRHQGWRRRGRRMTRRGGSRPARATSRRWSACWPGAADAIRRPQHRRRSGTGSCMAARTTPAPCWSTDAILDELEALESRWRRCTSRTTSRRSASSAPWRRSCRRSPASTRRSTAASRRWRSTSRCRASITARGVRRYGFHGLSYEYVASAMGGYDPAPRPSSASSSPTSATAPALCAMPGGPQRRHDDGLHRPGRADDGHALRLARSRRDLLPHARRRHEPRRGRAVPLHANAGCSASPASPTTCAPCARRPPSIPGARGARPLRLPDRARDRLAGRRPGRDRRARLHRRHRRERRRHARRGDGRPRLPRLCARSRANAADGPRISPGPALRPGSSRPTRN